MGMRPQVPLGVRQGLAGRDGSTTEEAIMAERIAENKHWRRDESTRINFRDDARPSSKYAALVIERLRPRNSLLYRQSNKSAQSNEAFKLVDQVLLYVVKKCNLQLKIFVSELPFACLLPQGGCVQKI